MGLSGISFPWRTRFGCEHFRRVRGILLGVVGCAVLLCASQSHAQMVEVNLDPSKTTIDFTLGATFHTVHGVFKLKKGAILFDEATGKAAGTIVVDATSAQSGNDSRDRKMHQDVLRSNAFPEIVFTAASISGDVQQLVSGAPQIHITLAGSFRLCGQEHAASIPISIDRSAGESKAAAAFSIPYVQWGLKDPSTAFLRVKNAVDVHLETVPHIAVQRGPTH